MGVPSSERLSTKSAVPESAENASPSEKRRLARYECVFCKIVRKEAPAQIVKEWGDMIAFVPLNPVTPGHVLVVPRMHVEDALETPWITGNAFMRAAQLAEKVGSCNLITSVGSAATQTIHHLHVHIVPRVHDDGLSLPWTEHEQIGWADSAGRWIGPVDSKYGVGFEDRAVFVRRAHNDADTTPAEGSDTGR